ncbi:hypothetical protein ACA910_006724 [Epithemia clementina (nom. ined.)]
MNDAVTIFLSVAGQGLSAWMMQSMSPSASNAISQQYIDKCMKAEILKLKEANACLSQKAAAQEVKIPPMSINCDRSLSTEEQETAPFVDFLQPCTATDSEDAEEKEEKEELNPTFRTMLKKKKDDKQKKT